MRTEEEAMELYHQHEKYVRQTMLRRFNNQSLWQQHRVTEDDIIQHGRLGLYKACETYDESKGTSFKTFALYNIYWAMSNEFLRESLTREKGKYTFSSECRVSLDESLISHYECCDVDSLHDIVHDTEANNSLREKELEYNLTQLGKIISKQCEEVVRLRLKGYNSSEIANTLGVTHQRVSNVLRVHKDEIKNILLKNI